MHIRRLQPFRIRYSLIITLLFMVIGSRATAQNKQIISRADFPLWTITSDTATIYLAGDYSYSGKYIISHYEITVPDTIMQPFLKSDHLVIETIDTQFVKRKSLNTIVDQLTVYPNNQTIKDTIPPELYSKIKKNMYPKTGYRVKKLEKFKPSAFAFIYSAIQQLQDTKIHPFDDHMYISNIYLSYNKSYDLSIFFQDTMRSIKYKDKTLIELEDRETYVRESFSVFTDHEQLLLDYVITHDHYPLYDPDDDFINNWLKGNTDALDKAYRDYFKAVADRGAAYRPLVIDYFRYKKKKNDAFFTKLDQFLTTDDTYFVLINIEELIGGYNLIDMLKEAGYTVTSP